ncbi:hypothetical protein SADO_15094 [Salinisphaera dokdonensis CL-ES53]|uniref:Uncharacterized protein n=1 Tax=Salinisphaera dokdonensis CL-ES53 TaxID=1304272 RepID=A0ABV2B403_9GAMM
MSEQDLIEASPCKLRNGDWGCKTTEPVKVGDTVQIVTRANKQWRAQITQIVWTDDQACICATESENSKKKAGGSDEKPAKSAVPKKSSAKASAASPAPDEHVPAPPRTDAIPTDDLDAMADAAAEQEGEFDDVMSAMAEFERNEQG